MEKRRQDESIPIWLYVVGYGLLVYLFSYTFSFVGGWLGDVLIALLMQMATIGIHEGSHLLAIAINLPRIAVIASGTLGQIGFVLICLGVAAWKKAYFAAAFMGLWLAYSLQNTAIYMLDARDRVLDLVTPIPGADSQAGHDWFNMFSHWGLMPHYKIIGDVTMAAGFGIGVISILLGAYAIVRLWLLRRETLVTPPAQVQKALAIKLKNVVNLNGKQTGASDELFNGYAAMALQFGGRIDAVHMHRAWQEWAARYDTASPYRTAYSLLPPERKVYYEQLANTAVAYG